ncbi:MAG: Asp-tRNA(Asn)/Glu-tRNA(Gln) amidotransferase subunit GatB [Candidatus Methanoplasma sp.]|jgi:aspartyl-tRNA(Asn)/glutamyl-tRNA(Gln) amidotransferase subunit B|nr:Asp-tRNA(Asn)/Glu-tRNA(Gln) amidotransferase subunit GatB [Candidatus Methanoplasma sp.]
MKIGLEIHVQLPTESKMFCSCPTTDADAPNTHVCPICLGMPGTRPVMNRKAVECGIKLAKMLNCQIPDTMWFSRKTYFYPDMSKGVQVTQFDHAVGSKGVYHIGKKPIGITKIQIEEDPGKTKRFGDKSSLVDYNRAGMPLAEIVTDPDFSTPAEAREFLKQLITDIRRTIDLPGDGERSIRCDCNISVGIERCEVKNVSGLRNVERALTFEAIRQTKILKAGGKIERETRGFDEERGVTFSVRKKEYESDYGYIEEPDIGIFHIRELADSITIKESHVTMAARLSKEYGLDEKTANQMVLTSVGLAELFELIVKATGDVQMAVSWTRGTISANWKAFEASGKDPAGISEILVRFGKGEITDVETDMGIKSYMTGKDAKTVKEQNADLEHIIAEYLDAHPEIIDEMRKNDKTVNRVIGHAMKETGGKYSSSDIVSVTKRLLESKL